MTRMVAEAFLPVAERAYKEHLTKHHGGYRPGAANRAPFNYYCQTCYAIQADMIKALDDTDRQNWSML